MILAEVTISDELGQVVSFVTEVVPSKYPAFELKGWREVAALLAELRPEQTDGD